MIEHDAATRAVLRRCGMSLQSELSRQERAELPAAKRALKRNPNISSYQLYRILRPRGKDSAL